MSRKSEDLTDKTFGSLLVEKLSERPANFSQAGKYWECLCECGKTIITNTSRLNCGDSRSCGCKKFVDLTKERFGKLLVLSRNLVKSIYYKVAKKY